MSQLQELGKLLEAIGKLRNSDYNIDIPQGGEFDEIRAFIYMAAAKLSELKRSDPDAFSDLNKSVCNTVLTVKRSAEEILAGIELVNGNLNVLDHLFLQMEALLDSPEKINGLVQRVKDRCYEGIETSFDIISYLEFKDISQRMADDVASKLSLHEEQMTYLAQELNIKTVEEKKDDKEVLQDQSLVNKLLQEFGL